MYGSPEKEVEIHKYAATLRTTLLKAYQLVRTTTSQRHEHQKPLYDKRVHGSPYSPGDLVWVFSDVVKRGQCRKLHHPWTGPFKVIDQMSDVTYRVKNLRGNRRQMVIHFDRLKPCSLPPDSDSTSHCYHRPVITHSRPNIGDNLELVDTEDTQSMSTPSGHNEDTQAMPTSSPPPTTQSSLVLPPTPSSGPRYPTRDRRPPSSDFPFVTH